MGNLKSEIEIIINSTDADERRIAAESIIDAGEFDQQIISTFVDCLSDSDKGVADSCIRGLQNVPDELKKFTSQKLSELLKSNNISVRNAASDLLISYGSEAVSSLVNLLKEKDDDAKKFAIDILGLISDASTLDEMLELIKDKDPNIAVSAVEAVGNIFYEKDLEETLRHDSLFILISHFQVNEELRPAIIEAISKIGDSKSIEFLLDQLHKEEDFFNKIAIIDGLSLCGNDISICYKLMENLHDEDENLQLIYLKTIMAIAHRVEEEIVLHNELRNIARKGLEDDDEDTRNASLLALGMQYEPEDSEGLIVALQHSNNDVIDFILNNLLFNSDYEVYERFINYFYEHYDPDKTPIENDIANSIIVLIDSLDERYKITAIEAMIINYLEKALVSLDLFLRFTDLYRDISEEVFQREYQKLNKEKQSMVADLASSLEIELENH